MQEARRYKLIHLELKYCELCGALWLRPIPLAGAYCGTCQRTARELASAAAQNTRRPPCKHR